MMTDDDDDNINNSNILLLLLNENILLLIKQIIIVYIYNASSNALSANKIHTLYYPKTTTIILSAYKTQTVLPSLHR